MFMLGVYTLILVGYAICIWKYYTLLSKHQIIELNLSKYNYSSHPLGEKLIAIVLYTIEYLIILPFFVLLWFTFLSVFLLVLSQSLNTMQILLISAAIITSTRITAYIDHALSEDIAKLFPLTVLATFFIGFEVNISDIFSKFYELPSLLDYIFLFLVFIFIIEFSLRLLYLGVQFLRSNNDEDDEDDD